MKTQKGTYLFLFLLKEDLKVKTLGRRKFLLPKGVYVYVGSAFGSGGIEARVKRHLRRDKKLHWHLDWVTTSKKFHFLDYVPFYNRRWECKIASFLQKLEIFEPVEGFGSTDCGCPSHLFRLKGSEKLLPALRAGF